jgi:hypothetical protein
MLNSKKGVSALQIQRQIGSGSYETAWYMCMRLRASMRDPDFRQLMGIVEVDEMFIGGKDKNRHWDQKSHVTGGIGSSKVGIIGAISRKGNVVCQIIENTDAITLNAFVRKAVSETVDLVATDEHSGYRFLNEYFPHEAASHGAGEYVRGEVHTNTLESFWSLFKRGVMGSFHHVSKKYLPLYLAEFQFRHNKPARIRHFRQRGSGGLKLKHGNWRMLQSKHPDASKPVQLELSLRYISRDQSTTEGGNS